MQFGTYDAYRAVRTFAALDGLRCLAVLAVVWHHSVEDPSIARWVPATRYGFLGVDLFFEISGFLIVTLILRERGARGAVSLKNFYARRALRIFPLYYGILAAFALLFFVIRPHGTGAPAFREELWVMALYLSNWIPVSGMFAITWSLAAEEQFYLFWPPIERWFARHAEKVIVAIIVVSQLVHFGWIDPLLGRLFGWTPGEPAFLRQTTFTPICFGVLLAHVLHDPARYRWVASWLGRPLAAPLALALLILVCNVLPDDIRGTGRLVVHLVMLVLLASTVVREDNGLRGFLAWPAVARIGALSYGIYLLHHTGLGIVSGLLGKLGSEPHSLVLFVLGSALTFGFANISYRWYESRFLRLRDRFRGGSELASRKAHAVSVAPAEQSIGRPDARPIDAGAAGPKRAE